MKLINNNIRCNRCDHSVKIPLIWKCGIEIVFYCPKCRKPFLLNYRLGAIAWAIGIIAATLTVQIIGLIGCGFATILSVVIFIPIMGLTSLYIRTKLLIHNSGKKQTSNNISTQEIHQQFPPYSE